MRRSPSRYNSEVDGSDNVSSENRQIKIGARFKMSERGIARSPSLAGKEGIIIGAGRYRNAVRVKFDSYKSPTTLHRDYIDLIPSEAAASKPQ